MWNGHNDDGYVERDWVEEADEKSAETERRRRELQQDALLRRIVRYQSWLLDNTGGHPITHFEGVSVEQLNKDIAAL